MQRMAELMEESRRIIPRDQHRLAWFSLHEVRVVRDDRRYRRIELFLAAIRVHPRTRPLSGTCIGIEVPQADVLSRRAVLHFPHAHIRMIDRDVGNRSELETEQLTRDPEHSLTQLLELEVRLHRILVEIVSLLPHLFSIVAIVPRLDSDVLAFSFRKLLHVGDFFLHPLNGRLPHCLHQLHRTLGSLCHRVLETPVRMRRITKELRTLGTKLKDLRDVLLVCRRAAFAAVDEHAPDLLAKVAAIRVGEEGIHRRARVRDDPLAWLSLSRCGCSGSIAQRLRKPGEFGFAVEHEYLVGLVSQHVLVERREERGKPLVDLR